MIRLPKPASTSRIGSSQSILFSASLLMLMTGGLCQEMLVQHNQYPLLSRHVAGHQNRLGAGQETSATVRDHTSRMNTIHETTNWNLLDELSQYHNAIRYFHQADELQLNRTLMDYARLRALIFAWYDGNVPYEDPGTGNIYFGENIHWTSMQPDDFDAFDIFEDWYFEEEPQWDFDYPYISDETREFAQIVWRSTTQFGCGQAMSGGTRGGTYTVCMYDPAGNIDGEEGENVRPAFTGDYDFFSGVISQEGSGSAEPLPAEYTQSQGAEKKDSDPELPNTCRKVTPEIVKARVSVMKSESRNKRAVGNSFQPTIFSEMIPEGAQIYPMLDV